MNRKVRVARIVATTGAAALVAATLTTAAVAAPGNAGDRGLGKHDRELVAAAVAKGDKTVTLIVSTTPKANAGVVSAIASLGGSIGYRDDALGYLRVVVPTGSADRVVGLAGVEAVDVDEIIPLEDPKPVGGGFSNPAPAPGASTPADNPYMPIGDTGAAQFVAANPTWDGRGTTIGIIDTGVDLGHPALQTTTTGERKVVDWVTATSPTADPDPTWIAMGTQVQGPSFAVNGTTYAAPGADSYRFGVFNEGNPLLGGELGNDVNRDGDKTDVFGVLWDGKTTVWVDADQDLSFADETAMSDYKVAQQVGRFGTDNPATEVSESLPFVVQTDGKNKYVNIGIVSGAHGSHVAGITAANGMFGGAMTGAAPGAKLVSVRVCLFVAGCTSHALLEGMIYAAKQANVDVINMSIGGLPALNDGNNARAALYDKLIEQSNVQMFISAGNSGPGLNTIGDPSVASKVMSVGSHVTKETWTSNYGSTSAYDDNLHYYSSRGPREDGGFKPQIVAPGSAVSTVPTWQLGSCLGYTCPPGYAMFNGTSMASPQAAGAAALLVSAAKATGVQFQTAQLRTAINSTARFLPNYQAYEQGNGLFDVAGAWDVLKSKVTPVEIRSAVDVNTVLSGFLATAGRGVGIYDREGVVLGKSYVREYTFTRTSGAGGSKTYAVSWVGNDETFASPSSITLPLNTPVTFPVTVNPAAMGIHSAILNLDDASTPGVDGQTMNTVVVAEQFTAANGYTVTKEGTVDRNQSVSHFFSVPAGTPAFKIDMVGGGIDAGAGQIRFLRWHPYGVGIDSNASTSCYNPAAGACSTGSPTSRTVANPQPGVWEVTVDARRTSDAPSTDYSITASVLGAEVTPNPDVIASATAGTAVEREYSAKNLFGAFTGRMVGTGLGSAYRNVESIDHHAVKQYTVTVPSGATSLRATIGGTSDKGADLDLFVYRDGKLVGQSADGDSEESVSIANPVGTYTVVVDGYSVPEGTTTFNYVDVFNHTSFGAVAVTDANAARAGGSTWSVPGAVTANTAPAAGRVLLGAVEVRTDQNVLVGSGDVLVQSVTP